MLKEQGNDFKEDFLGAENIYDILVILYSYIDNINAPSYVQNYYEKLDEGEVNEWKSVNTLLDAFLGCDIDFSCFLNELVLLVKDNNYTSYAVHILKYFDQIFFEKEEYQSLGFNNRADFKNKSILGPLNTNQEKYRLYFMPKSSMLDESIALKECKCRFINRKDGSNIFSEISSYKIINRTGNKAVVKITEYNENIFLKDGDKEKNYRIAIVPVSNKEWFEVRYISNNSDKNYFEIINKENLMEEINNKYITLLNKLMNDKVEIVIFPELAMNSKTEQVISKYLTETSLLNPNHTLKLIFMGSLWEDGRNQCVLFSGKGSVLIRNDKKSPFSLYKDGKRYDEKLRSRPAEYEVLDVQHLGRILYLICKDGLEDLDQIEFWNEYGINFEVISSYSKSVSYFEEQMKEFAEKYKGIGILSNCCSLRSEVGTDNISVGFIETPAMRKKEPFRTEGVSDKYFIEKSCKEKCSFCDCIHIFDIKPDILEENDLLSKICIEHSRK